MANPEGAGQAVLAMQRTLPVCVPCWSQRYPQAKVPPRAIGGGFTCTVCQKGSAEVVYVRMEVEWHG